MIIALAGRRTDPLDAPVPRLPLAKSAQVRARLRTLFVEQGSTCLVCSASCGADLLALDAARELGMRRRIVLPFSVQQFRTTSVTDRPGDWGPLFDLIIEEVQAAGDLVILNEQSSDDQTLYAMTNQFILDEAQALAQQASQAAGDQPFPPILTVIVWEGQSRGPDDLTEALANEARTRGIPVREVPTM